MKPIFKFTILGLVMGCGLSSQAIDEGELHIVESTAYAFCRNPESAAIEQVLQEAKKLCQQIHEDLIPVSDKPPEITHSPNPNGCGWYTNQSTARYEFACQSRSVHRVSAPGAIACYGEMDVSSSEAEQKAVETCEELYPGLVPQFIGEAKVLAVHRFPRCAWSTHRFADVELSFVCTDKGELK